MARLSLSLAALLLAGCADLRTAPPSPPAPAPARVEVAAWGGTPSRSSQPAQRIEHITVHHSGLVWQPGSDPEAYLRRLQQWSRLSKQWVDIPYHYVIAPDGRVFEARPLALSGDTNTEYDPRGHALVMLLGNFEEQTPSPEALAATEQLIVWLARRHGLEAAQVQGHRDHSRQTVCPGAALQSQLPALREAVARALAARP